MYYNIELTILAKNQDHSNNEYVFHNSEYCCISIPQFSQVENRKQPKMTTNEFTTALTNPK